MACLNGRLWYCMARRLDVFLKRVLDECEVGPEGLASQGSGTRLVTLNRKLRQTQNPKPFCRHLELLCCNKLTERCCQLEKKTVCGGHQVHSSAAASAGGIPVSFTAP